MFLSVLAKNWEKLTDYQRKLKLHFPHKRKRIKYLYPHRK